MQAGEVEIERGHFYKEAGACREVAILKSFAKLLSPRQNPVFLREMFLETSADALRLAAAIAILGVGVSLTWVLCLAAGILRRVLKIARLAERFVEKVDSYLARPVAALSSAIEDLAPVIRFFARRG